MNPQLNYYLGQARTADLIRQAQRQRLARPARRRRRRPWPAIDRIVDSVGRAHTTSVPTSQHPPLKTCQ